ncbi:hypothetical protein L6452_17992 [Arctium lappa]|uniref:Uncharacterized protein n=1 Tax=Arctium lappa TaxID=4217 RepID=A0ACB9C4Y0_ARCLA|nr:hypothetical protein L6452_17992 [Arctium lappa]
MLFLVSYGKNLLKMLCYVPYGEKPDVIISNLTLIEFHFYLTLDKESTRKSNFIESCYQFVKGLCFSFQFSSAATDMQIPEEIERVMVRIEAYLSIRRRVSDVGHLITCMNDLKVVLSSIVSMKETTFGNSLADRRLLVSLMEPTIEYMMRCVFKDPNQSLHKSCAVVELGLSKDLSSIQCRNLGEGFIRTKTKMLSCSICVELLVRHIRSDAMPQQLVGAAVYEERSFIVVGARGTILKMKLPHKIPLYGTVIGLLNLENEELVKKILETTRKSLQCSVNSHNDRQNDGLSTYI